MIAAGVALSMLVVWAVSAWLAPWSPKRGLGLVFGILASLIFVFEMAYPYRRSRARPFGTARRWLQLHVYLGALAFLAVLIHGLPLAGRVHGLGPAAPSGWTTITGSSGCGAEAAARRRDVEGCGSRRRAHSRPRRALVKEADALVANTSEVLERFYLAEVRTAASGRPSVVPARRAPGASAARALPAHELLRGSGGVGDRERPGDHPYGEDGPRRTTAWGILRSWLIVHVPRRP